MKYISIGAVMTAGTEHIVDVTRGCNKFRLTGDKVNLWLNGRCGFAYAGKPSDLVTLEQLYKMGLVIKCDGSSAEEYRALTKCTIVPTERKNPFFGLWGMEKTVLLWLRNAGLVLSMAELTYLIDRNVQMEDQLLGKENAQGLVERIYTKDTIFNNILENQIERAKVRDEVVKAVIGLLRKKRLVLL